MICSAARKLGHSGDKGSFAPCPHLLRIEPDKSGAVVASKLDAAYLPSTVVHTRSPGEERLKKIGIGRNICSIREYHRRRSGLTAWTAMVDGGFGHWPIQSLKRECRDETRVSFSHYRCLPTASIG